MLKGGKLVSNSLLGIEIGNNNIKIVHTVKSGKILTLLNYGIIPTPENSVRDGAITNMDAVQDTLHELMKKKRFQEKNTAIMVQGTSIITRDVEMPLLNEKELQKTFEFKKEEFFPIDVTEYHTDYKILKEINSLEGKKYSAMVVAVPNILINQSIELLDRLNLPVKAIDILSNSISKMFVEKTASPKDESAQAVMILDIGGQTTTVTILSQGVVLFSRAIFYGFSEINYAIANQFGTSDFNEIESFKKKYAAIYEDEEQYEDDLYGGYISKTIKPAIDNNLMQEINRFLEFLYSRESKFKIKTIYLIGGGGYLKNLDRYITKVFNIPTFKGNDFSSVRFKGLKNFEDDFLYLVNALGLTNR